MDRKSPNKVPLAHCVMPATCIANSQILNFNAAEIEVLERQTDEGMDTTTSDYRMPLELHPMRHN